MSTIDERRERRNRARGAGAWPAVLAVIVVAMLSAAQRAVALTPETYCLATRDLLQTSVAEWQEKVAVAAQLSGAPAADLRNGLLGVEKRFEPLRASVYARYDTSPQAYLAFMGGHGPAVHGYLAAHPDLAREIKGLAAQEGALADQVEAISRPKRSRGR